MTNEQAVREILGLIDSPLLPDVDDPGRTFHRVYFEAGTRSSLSAGEKALVDIAYSLWRCNDDQGARVCAIGWLDKGLRAKVLGVLTELYVGAAVTLESEMFAIKSLDNQASIHLSEYTGMWYISARIEISDGVILTGVTEHRSTPVLAVRAYHDKLRSILLDEVIVASPAGERREFRWNGAAFAEQNGSIRERAAGAAAYAAGEGMEG